MKETKDNGNKHRNKANHTCSRNDAIFGMKLSAYSNSFKGPSRERVLRELTTAQIEGKSAKSFFTSCPHLSDPQNYLVNKRPFLVGWDVMGNE